MTDVSAPLPDEFRQAVARHATELGGFARDIHYYEQAGSTNDLAAVLAGGGVPEGTVVLAAAQTAGRGRQRRQWHSPPGGGLYFSVVFRPRDAQVGDGDAGALLVAPQTSLLTLMAGEAVADGISRATGLEAALKWPNDLVVEAAAPACVSAWRKLGGILAEASVEGERVRHVVVGIGINVRPAAYPPEVRDRATSLESELGREVDAATVFAACLAALARGRSDLVEGRARLVLERWRRRAPSAVGRHVTWEGPDGPWHGVTRGVDDTGALLIEHEGRVVRVVAGDVLWT